MKLNSGKEKYFIYALCLLIIGWSYHFILSYLNSLDFEKQFTFDNLLIAFPKPGKYNTVWFEAIGIGFGLASLFLSYKCKISNKKRVVMVLSLLLIIMSFFFYPNWRYYYFLNS